ncbi:MAG: hypothetical protein GX295_03370 [Syntrophomonadaceae bacterium]|nr:hypothetical protein [Syntrophomonadaceae bacterium]
MNLTEQDRVEKRDEGDTQEPLRPGLSFGARMWGVLTAPRMTFQDIAQRPTFWGVLLLQVLAGGVFAWIISPKLQEFTRLTLEQSGQVMPPDLMQMTMTMVMVQGILAALIIPPLLWLLQAGLLKLYAQFALGEGTFRQLFAVAVWSSIPSLLSGIVHTILIQMTEAKDFLTVQTSLALFLPASDTISFLYLFLSQFDFFIIWGLVLLALGAGAVFRQRATRIGVYLFTLWLIYVVTAAGLGTYFSGKI